ncbi:MAG TPA: nucleoside 2-deoxyribosyltransferase [Methylomirabilota bacterium]|jgi:nucleoside 2-deoxyribosyltransferase|nr:nucleoside 2-deoxyribosyltransferase [Methylomirabilota bacterium]
MERHERMERRKIYLAGPEVFLPDALAQGARKKRLCEEFGFQGLFPLDNEIEKTPAVDMARAIYRANCALMREADLIIANLTPFRGVSADVGTAFELGMVAGMGKPVVGYTNVAANLLERAKMSLPGVGYDVARGAWVDNLGMVIEDFDGADNLMLDMGLDEGGMPIVRLDVPAAERFTNLEAFVICLRLARSFFAS